MFESWVAAEIYKARAHAGLPPGLFHIRVDRGLDLDLLVQTDSRVVGVEVKSGATVVSEFLRSLLRFRDAISDLDPHLEATLRLVSGGERGATQRGVRVIPWREIQDVEW